MDVKLPDGTILQGVPEGTTQEQLLGRLQLAGHPAAKPLMEQMAQQQMTNALSNTSGPEKFIAGYGSALPRAWQGVKQALSIGDQKKLQEEIDETKRINAPLDKSLGGAAGNIAGNAAMFAPTAAIPGANAYTGAALVGAASGALQPVATGESRGLNTALGAAAGPAGQLVGRGLGRAITPIASRLSQQTAPLAQAAGREGIPLTVGQQTGSRPLQIAESVMENLPLTSAPQLAQRETQQRAFTAAALRRAGMNADVATAPALSGQKSTLGKTMGDIAERNSLDFSQGLRQKLDDIGADAGRHLPPELASKVTGTIEKIQHQADVQSALVGGMSGQSYQGWREPLRSLSNEAGTGRYFQQIRSALDEAFRTQLPGTEGEAFRSTSRQYANLKTIIDAMGGAGKLPAEGQIAPAQLSAALARAMGRENKALGAGDLNELTRIGQSFVKEQIPNSGTAQRQIIQNLLTANLPGAAAGAGLGYYEGRDLQSAGIGALGGAGVALGGPRMAQAIMQSPTARRYIENQALSPTARKALAAALRTGAMASVPQLTSQ